MFRKSFVLLSGGLDSTVCLHVAMRQSHLVEAVSISYGQRHKKEMDYARKTCEKYNIPHTILDVGALLRGDTVMLTDDSRGTVEVPDVSYADIKGVSPTYVPFRNGLMLSALTAHAQKWVTGEIESYAQHLFVQHDMDSIEEAKEVATYELRNLAGIFYGAHADDAANFAYPDCTPEFNGAMANAINIGSYYTIKLMTPLQWSDKSEAVALGARLGVDFADTWSCYKGEDKHCGTCPTCRSRKEAFIKAGVPDPTDYAA